MGAYDCIVHCIIVYVNKQHVFSFLIYFNAFAVILMAIFLYCFFYIVICMIIIIHKLGKVIAQLLEQLISYSKVKTRLH